MLIYAWWDHHDWVSRNAVSWRGPRLILWWWYLDYLITRVRGLRIEFPLPTSLVIKLVTSIKIWWVHHLLTCLHVRGVIWVPTIYVGGLGPNTQSPTLLVLWLHIMTGSNGCKVPGTCKGDEIEHRYSLNLVPALLVCTKAVHVHA